MVRYPPFLTRFLERFIENSSLSSTVGLQDAKGVTEAIDPMRRMGRKWFAEEFERRTEHTKRLVDEIEWRCHKAERQGLNVTAPIAEQLKKKRNRTETP